MTEEQNHMKNQIINYGTLFWSAAIIFLCLSSDELVCGNSYMRGRSMNRFVFNLSESEHDVQCSDASIRIAESSLDELYSFNSSRRLSFIHHHVRNTFEISSAFLIKSIHISERNHRIQNRWYYSLLIASIFLVSSLEMENYELRKIE